MNIYWLLIIMTYLLSIASRTFIKKEDAINMKDPGEYTVNTFYAFLVLMCLVLVAGFRSEFGDTATYRSWYHMIGNDWKLAFKRTDSGFYLIMALMNMVSKHSQFFVFMMSFFTYGMIFHSLCKYSPRLEMSVYLLITSGIYMSMTNGIRQGLAAAILFLNIKLLLNGKWKQYFLVVLLCSTIHFSAIIMIPVYFIVRKKSWNLNTFFIIIFTSVAYMFFNQFFQQFVILFGGQYSKYAEFLFIEGQGSNFIRVIISLLPLIMSYIYRSSLRKYWSKSDIVVNLSLINFIFTLFSTYNWIFARFTIYFDLYNLLIYSWIIGVILNKRLKIIIYPIFILSFIIFFYYQMALVWNVNYIPFWRSMII